MTTAPKSTSHVDEQLSAWLDDELPAGELELLATRLAGAPELRERVARYALIGSRMRAGRTGNLAGDLLALRLGERVQAAVGGQPEFVRATDGRRIARWLPFAIAAGAALLAIALVPLMRTEIYPPPANHQIARSAVLPAAVTPVSLSSNRMTGYLVYHGEFSGMLSAKVTDSNIINHRATALAAPLAGGASTR
jgi:anti-sigma factor RsiW